MNVSKQVFSRLFKEEKTELESNRVELAIDIKSIGQKAQSIFNDGRKNALQKISLAADEMQSAQKELKSLSKQLDSEYSKNLKIAKEIGVDLNSTTVGKSFKIAFSEIEEYIMSSRELSNKYSKIK